MSILTVKICDSDTITIVLKDKSDLKLNGVYRISCKNTGFSYYGSTSQLRGFRGRFECHISKLRRNIHESKSMQRDWNFYGESSFVFEILEICDRSSCVVREQVYLDTFGVGEANQSYNNAPVANSCLGVKHSAETVAKRIAVGKAIAQTEKAKQNYKKLAEMYKNKPLSMQHRRKISESHKGKKLAEDHKRIFLDAGRKATTKWYVVTSPDGKAQTVYGLQGFCRENGLDPALMTRVARGKNNHHKGWKVQYLDPALVTPSFTPVQLNLFD